MAETTSNPAVSGGAAAGDGDLAARPFAWHGYSGKHTAPNGGGLAYPGRGGSQQPAAIIPGDGMPDYIALVTSLIQAGSTTDDQAARLVEQLVKTSSRVHALISESLAEVLTIMKPHP